MFPLLYHAHLSNHSDDIPFWLDLAVQQGGPILELGCGTGRVLIPLAQAGYPVVGLDSSSQMLAVLRQNLPTHLQPLVGFLQADLAAFHFRIRFSLILLPCNTYSMIAAPDRRNALIRICQHLRPDGLFAFSVPNPGLLKRLTRYSAPELEESFSHPLDGEPVQVSSAWKRTSEAITFSWYYDHMLPDGQVERASMQARHFLTPVEAYLEELNQAGLQVVNTFGDFDGSPYQEDALNFILIVKKKT